MARLFRFGRFELDASSQDLRKDGRPLKLPPQPTRVLALLVSRAGQVVPLDQIRHEVWGDETFVDFEAGLHYCLTRIRNVLGEKAGARHWIQTLPKRGYRFVAPVTTHDAITAVAVLPFANLNEDPAFDYFAEGVADMLTTALGSLGVMRVISRQSTLQFRGSSLPLQQIARTLGVDAIVEGSVLRAGQRVRVTVQLIEAAPERHLWAQAYECANADILDVQRHLASSIVAAVDRTLHAAPPPADESSIRASAHEEYLKGRLHAAEWTRDGLTTAIHQFQRAVDLEPSFALAHAALANAFALLGYWNHVPARDAYPQAKAAALRALSLDDTLSEAHAALSWVLLWCDWDLARSEEEQTRAIALNPSNESVRIQHALDAASIRQDRNVALAEMSEALRLDPLSVMTGSAAAWILFFVREYERAAKQARATLEMHPLALQAFYALGLAEAMLGRASEAIRALERAVEISPVPLSFAYLGRVLASAGQPERARTILQRLLALDPADLVSTKPLVILHAALGERDRAFECLERAFEARDTVLFSLAAVAVYDPLRADPRLDRLIARVQTALGMAAPA